MEKGAGSETGGGKTVLQMICNAVNTSELSGRWFTIVMDH